jgi:hypothetical protein
MKPLSFDAEHLSSKSERLSLDRQPLSARSEPLLADSERLSLDWQPVSARSEPLLVEPQPLSRERATHSMHPEHACARETSHAETRPC